MLDLPRWSRWLQEKVDQLRNEGLTTELKVGATKMGFGVMGTNAHGYVEIWISGDTDFTIMAPPSRTMKMVAHEWGVISTDESFAGTFDKFIAEFYKFEYLK
jgi:hypothetical protein